MPDKNIIWHFFLFNFINMKVNVKSPGRVNLIGEHTDYNGGYVLPCALNLSIELDIEKTHENSFVSTDLGYSMHFDVKSDFKKSNNHWENYILGVINELKQIKPQIDNFICKISSTLPSGAGISSSSALVCGLIKGLSVLNNLNLDNSEVIKLSRNVEHKYIGVLGGIMDQYTILNAKENKAILLNCENVKSKYIDINFGEYEILLLEPHKVLVDLIRKFKLKRKYRDSFKLERHELNANFDINIGSHTKHFFDKTKYINPDIKKVLPENTIKIINNNIDLNLMDFYNYDMVTI